MSRIVQTDSHGRVFYCVYWRKVVRDPRTGRPVESFIFDYMHAQDERDARYQCLAANAQEIHRQRGKIQILWAAPAVGWHAQDDNGDVAVA